MSEGNKLQNLLQELEKNPLFQMSLGSKELFHSNLLAWIISQKSQSNFVHKFLEKTLDLKDKIAKISQYPEREKMNIDLRFELEMGDDEKSHLWIIIENKVKSLPYKEQLVKYEEETKKELKKELKKEKTTDRYYLLSLINPGREILPDKWELIRYNNVAENLKAFIGEIKNTDEIIPFKKVIESYIHFIKNLHELSEFIEIKDSGKNESFDYTNIGKNKNERAEFERIRLHDLYLKIKHQQISDLIKDRIRNSNIKPGVNECDPWENLKPKNIEKSKTLPVISDGFYVKGGFSDSNGMVDFKYIPFTFHINNEKAYCVLCIQLQANQLRYALEFIGKFENKKLANKLLYKAGFKMFEEKSWISFSRDFLKGKDLDRKLYFSNSELQGKAKKKKENDPDREFCVFGDFYIYKYDVVEPEVTVEQIVNLYGLMFEYLISKKDYFKKVIEESKVELSIE